MPVLDSYLFFNGNCADAMRFYEKTLGARVEMMMTYAQSPQPEHGAAAGAENLIMHASLLVGDRRLMASDTPADHPRNAMNGFALSLTYATPDEARQVFDALSVGGKVTMPVAKTFWAEAFGMLVDRFGTPWIVNGGARG